MSIIDKATPRIDDRTALLLIDIQNDFCPGGALAVPEGDRIVPVVNGLIPNFGHVILTQDWHPTNHGSFASTHGAQPFTTTRAAYGEQMLWPDHCVQGTRGAEFHPDLEVTRAELVIRKGFRPGIDSYSAFLENDQATRTGLKGYLEERGIRRLFLAGLATDYCVAFSAIDASLAGFEVWLVKDACRGIDPAGIEQAMLRMGRHGVNFIEAAELVAYNAREA